jgi:hypothetical protein
VSQGPEEPDSLPEDLMGLPEPPSYVQELTFRKVSPGFVAACAQVIAECARAPQVRRRPDVIQVEALELDDGRLRLIIGNDSHYYVVTDLDVGREIERVEVVTSFPGTPPTPAGSQFGLRVPGKGAVIVDATGTSRLSAVEVRVRLLGPDGRLVGESTASAAVKEGEFTGHCVVSVDRPRLWWPRGYGDQPLYHAEVALLAEGRVQQTQRRTIGFRRVTMPELLHFVVNGVPVFLRGGAWVTPNLMSDVWDPAREERLFALAENANFNARSEEHTSELQSLS